MSTPATPELVAEIQALLERASELADRFAGLELIGDAIASAAVECDRYLNS